MRSYSGDIRLKIVNGVADIEVSDGDLVRDAGLETACLISLFTDARNIEETDFAEDVRGWWADNEAGSRLWLIDRSKTSAEVLGQALERAKAAYDWMLEDGVAAQVQVSAQRVNNELHITVEVTPPSNAEAEVFQFFYNWQAQLA